MQKTGSDRVHAGAIFDVHRERWTHDNGTTVSREIVRKPGAVAVLAYDDEHFWLVTQPREAIGDPDYIEIPAGLLDGQDESPTACAHRELAEECGLRADDWFVIAIVHTSPGFTDEQVTIYGATGLTRIERPAADDNATPIECSLHDLDRCIASAADAKTLIALLWLSEHLDG